MAQCYICRNNVQLCYSMDDMNVLCSTCHGILLARLNKIVDTHCANKYCHHKIDMNYLIFHGDVFELIFRVDHIQFYCCYCFQWAVDGLSDREMAVATVRRDLNQASLRQLPSILSDMLHRRQIPQDIIEDGIAEYLFDECWNDVLVTRLRRISDDLGLCWRTPSCVL